MYKNINELEEKMDFSNTDTMVIETEKASKKSSVEFFKKDHTEEISYIDAEDLIVLDTEKGQKKIKYKNFKTHSCLDFNKIGEINLNANYHLVNQDKLKTKLLNLINSFDISNNIYNGLGTSNKGIISAINEVYDLINDRPPIDPPYVEVETFELEISTLELGVNSTYTFNPTILPSNATDKTITWQINSNNDSRDLVALMEDNTIRGVNIGNCTVIAMCGNKISTCFVNVIQSESEYIPIESIKITLGNNVKLNIGESIEIPYTLTPSNTTDKEVTWSLDHYGNDNNEDVGEMIGNVFHALNTGFCSIMAYCGNKNDVVFIDVIDTPIEPPYEPITKITVNPSTYLLSKGQTGILSAGTVPFSSTNEKTWECSNTSLVAIEPSGSICNITGLAQKGTANVTVSCDGLSATCVVTLSK